MAIKSKVLVSLAGFQKVVALISQVSGKTFKEELNRNMLKLLVGAKGAKGLVQLTKKATADRIRGDLSKSVSWGSGRTGTLAEILAAKALRNAGQPATRGAIAAKAEAIIRARINTRAYIAASWLFSAKSLSKFVPGSGIGGADFPLKPGGKASKADADPATASDLKCTVFNTSEGAKIVAAPAIPRALDSVKRDMMKYVARKFGENLAKERGR